MSVGGGGGKRMKEVAVMTTRLWKHSSGRGVDGIVYAKDYSSSLSLYCLVGGRLVDLLVGAEYLFEQ
jgi:hypothetical protein